MNSDPSNNTRLPNKPVDFGSMLNITKPLGSGSIKKIDLVAGLSLYVWDCFFNDKISIPVADIGNSAMICYSLIYFLTPDAFYLEHELNPGIKFNSLWNTVFMSGHHNKSFIVEKMVSAKCVDIRFTKEWIETQYGTRGELFKNESIDKADLAKPILFFETYDYLEKKMIDDIYAMPEGSEINPVFIKSRVVTIINEFITKVSKRDFSVTPTANHGFEIAKIENKLAASVSGALPSVKDLAHEFCLSESTLKREFKKINGQSISQYFMQKKMEYAYKLVNDKSGNVSEIACMLGYEKVSRFISMFKKHHGVSPGALLKSQI
ncbi:MAG: AraC family transcriptional regulator [Bacteroidota bacterium]